MCSSLRKEYVWKIAVEFSIESWRSVVSYFAFDFSIDFDFFNFEGYIFNFFFSTLLILKHVANQRSNQLSGIFVNVHLKLLYMTCDI